MIGILDSGVGGLSVLREIHALLPEQELHYIGDSAWCPYGTKSPQLIQKRVAQLTDYLLSQGAELIVIACNSATIAAVEALRTIYPVPFVGMEPGIKPATTLTRSGTIGVLATEASLSGEKFHRLVSTHAQNLRVLTQPCPKFVTLVEEGNLDGEDVHEAILEYVDPLIAKDADVLILGCTHYPFLKPTLIRHLPDHVQLVDTGIAVAKRVASLVGTQNERHIQSASIQLQTTGPLNRFEQLVPRLCPDLINKANLSALQLA